MLTLVLISSLLFQSSSDFIEVCREPPQHRGELVVAGAAKSIHTEKLLYCEWYFEVSEVETTVLYTNPEGETVVEKKLDYRFGDSRPQTHQSDLRNGEKRVVRPLHDQEKWSMEYTPPGSKKVKTKIISDNSIEVVDSGFVNKVQQHWGDITAGDTSQTFSFASAFHQRNIALRISSTDVSDCNSPHQQDQVKLKNQKSYTCFTIELDNVFLRMLASNLILLFDQNKELIRFIGKSNILHTDLETPEVVIDYFYP